MHLHLHLLLRRKPLELVEYVQVGSGGAVVTIVLEEQTMRSTWEINS